MSIAQLLIKCIDALYRPFVARFVSRQLFGYALSGGLNMMLDALWYFVIYHFVVAEHNVDLGFVVISPHIASLIVVFPITFFTGFWLNRHVAFRCTEVPATGQFLRYGISVVGALAINYLCMKLFVDGLGLWPTPSKMLTTVVSVIYSFLAAKYFTFRRF